MENMKFNSIEDVDDVSTLDEYQVALTLALVRKKLFGEWPLFPGITRVRPCSGLTERTPGFTEGTPWLRVNPNCSRINVKDQEKNAGSVLSFYKKLTVLRKSEEYKETVVYGEFVPIWSRRRISSDISERVRKNFLFLPISRKRPEK